MLKAEYYSVREVLELPIGELFTNIVQRMCVGILLLVVIPSFALSLSLVVM